MQTNKAAIRQSENTGPTHQLNHRDTERQSNSTV
jgi:hypothetical protein